MGNKDSKGSSAPQPTSKPVPQAGSKGPSNLSVEVHNPVMKPALQPRAPANPSLSLARAVLSLIFRSEKVVAMAKDEVDLGEPLSKAPSKPAIEAMKKIRKAILDFEGSKDISEVVGLVEEISRTNKQSPVETVFNIMNTALKILQFECKAPTVPLTQVIQQFLDSEHDDLEGSETEKILVALAADLKKLNPGVADLSKTKGQELLAGLKTAFTQSVSLIELHLLGNTIQAASKHMYQQLDGESAIEKFLINLRQAVIYEGCQAILNDNIIQPWKSRESLIGYKTYQTAVSLTFGYAPFSNQGIKPRVKTMKIQVHREPDVLDLYFLESFTGVHIDGVKTYTDPNSLVVSRSSHIVDKLAICEPSVELKADYDCLTVFCKDNKFYYCLKDGQVFGQDVSQANLMSLNLHLVREPLINTLDTYKVVFMPKNTMIAKNFYYLVIFKKGDKLQKLKTFISDSFSENLGTSSNQILEKILHGLVFSDQRFAANSAEKGEALKASQSLIQSSGLWNTPIEKIMAKFGEQNRNISKDGQNKVDLIISLSSKQFNWNLEPNNLRREIRRQPIYLKAQLSDVWQQIYNSYFGSSVEEFSDIEIRTMLPTYLFVSLDSVSRMIDIPYELNFTGIEKRRQELDIEVSSRYRAVGFIAEKNNKESYTIYVNPQNRNEVYTYIGNKKYAAQMHSLNPNKIKAVYYERRERDL